MKKFVISILIILLMGVAMMGTSYAAQLTTTIEITPSVTEVSAGDKVVFSFVIRNVTNAFNDSIGAIEGKVEYNENFFELDSDTTLSAGGESGEKFNALKNTKEGGTIAKLVLKVKDNPTGSGKVKFTELAASDGDLDKGEEAVAKTADKEFTINLKSTTPTEPSGPSEPGTPEEPSGPSEPGTPEEPSGPSEPGASEEPSGTEEPSKTPGQNPGNQNGGKDITVADKDYDKAGISAIIVSAIIIVSVIAIAIYKKNQKFRDIK